MTLPNERWYVIPCEHDVRMAVGRADGQDGEPRFVGFYFSEWRVSRMETADLRRILADMRRALVEDCAQRRAA